MSLFSSRQRPSVDGGPNRRLRHSLGVALELEEVEDPPRGAARVRAEILEAHLEVAIAEHLLAVIGGPGVHPRPHGDRLKRTVETLLLGVEDDAAVLAQLVLVVGERHVPAVSQEVDEAERRHRRVEVLHAGRCSAAPSSPIRARRRGRSVQWLVTTSSRSAAISARCDSSEPAVRRDPVIDPAVRVRAEVDRVLVVVQPRAREEAARAHDAREYTGARASGGADHPWAHGSELRGELPGGAHRLLPLSTAVKGNGTPRRPYGPCATLVACRLAVARTCGFCSSSRCS